MKRAAYLKNHPTCETTGCRKKATDVHHHPRRLELVTWGVPDPDADQYLTALCHSHHSQITRRGG